MALVLDYNDSVFAQYGGGDRFLIFMFQTVNTRFAGILYRVAHKEMCDKKSEYLYPALTYRVDFFYR